MGFMDAVRTCLTRYIDFNGRAARSEFWWFVLFYIGVYVVLAILSSLLRLPIIGLLILGLFLPYLGVGVRRMHDTNRSGWFLLLGLIPLVGAIILIIWFAARGSVGENQYGPDPLGGSAAAPTPVSA